MKKLLGILLLLFMPYLSIKADSCGHYGKIKGNLSNSDEYYNNSYAVEKNGDFLYVYINDLKWYIPELTSCPEEVYILEDSDRNKKFYFDTQTDYQILLKRGLDDPTNQNNNQLIPGKKYDNIKTCQGQPYEYIQECGCMPSALTDLTSALYSLLKIAAPTLLLIIGGFDMIKAMTAQDDKSIKKAEQKLVQKFIAAAAVFLVFTVVEFLVSLISVDTKTTWKCVEYILSGYNV